MSALHCRHCGTDNTVNPDVVGKLCENCGKAIFSPEVEQHPKAARAVADRAGDVLRVTCPRCHFRNEFPELDMVCIFLCRKCSEPVSMEESVQ
jgi:hypothetical protein